MGKFWWSFNKADPFATPISLWADFRTDWERGAGAGKLSSTFVKSLATQVSGKTFGQGIRDVGRAFAGEGWDTWLVNFTASHVPNIYQQMARINQEHVGYNEADTLKERIAKRTELQDTDPVIDTWGRKAKNITGITGIKVASADLFKGDRVFLKWNQNNPDSKAYPSDPDETYKGQSGVDRKFTSKEFSDFKRTAGTLAKKLVMEVISSEHAKNPDILTLSQTRYIITQSRKKVKDYWKKNGDFDINEKLFIRDIRIGSKKNALAPKPKPVKVGDPGQNLEEELAAWEEIRAAQTRYKESFGKIRQ